MTAIALRVLVLVLAMLLVRLLLKPSPPPPQRRRAIGAGQDLDELVAICRGNPQQALELIVRETELQPDIDEQEACRRAIARHRDEQG